MMFLQRFSNFLLFLGSLFIATIMYSEAYAIEVKVLTSNMPPYSVDNSPQEPGFSTELIEAVFKAAKIPFNLRFVPWARAQVTTQDPKNTNYMMFTLSRTKAREPKYKWIFNVCPIRVGFISLEGDPFHTIEEAKKSGLRIGVCDGTPWIKFLVKHQVDSIDSAPNERSNGLKLLRNRIDLWYTAQDRGYYYLKKLGLKKKPVVGQPLQEYQLYLVANLNFPDEIVDKLKVAYERVKKQGTYQGLHDKYFSFEE